MGTRGVETCAAGGEEGRVELQVEGLIELQRGSVLGQRGGIECGINLENCGIDLMEAEILNEGELGKETDSVESEEVRKVWGESEQGPEELDEGEGTVREKDINKEGVRALPNPYWPLVQEEVPCPDASHFWHLCIWPAGQGDTVHEPLLKPKQNCWAGRVRNKEDVDEVKLVLDLEDLEAEASMHGNSIR